jgi:hypothetical protein
MLWFRSATWTSPAVVSESCLVAPNHSSVQGSQVLVDSGGTLYVTWESFAGLTETLTGTTRALWVRRSTDPVRNRQQFIFLA